MVSADPVDRQADPNPVVRLSRDGEILYANRASGPILAAWGSGVGGRLPESWRRRFQQVLLGDDLGPLELEADGRCFELAIAPPDGEGCSALFGRDITERRLAERISRQYEFIVNSSPDLMSFIGTHFVYRAVSDSYCAGHGRDRSGLVGRTVAEVWGQRQFEEVLRRPLEQALAGEQVRYRAWLTLAGSGRRHFEVINSPYRADGVRVSHVAAVARDITETKLIEQRLEESERRNRHIVEHSQGLICTHDLDGRLLSVNPAAAAALGYLPEDLRGVPLAELLAPRVRDQMASYLQMLRDEGVAQGIMRVLTRFGEEREWAYSNSHWEESGRPPYVLGHALDVTERRQARRELVEARRLAETANEAKGQFLAAVSHEVRSPLNVILGMTELALGTEVSDEQREFLSLIAVNAQAVLRLIKELLQFSRIEAGELEFEELPFEPAKVVREVIESLTPEARKKNLDLACEIAPGIEATLVGEPAHLRQVLVNLVNNGIKFTSRGRVSVALRPTTAQAPGELGLHFAVADTGVGIARRDLRRIFDRFVRGGSGEQEGTGLGLSIARTLVEMMGGRIWVESQPGSGSRFHFELSFQRFVPPREEADDRPLRRFAQGRVLLVEDHPAVGELARRHLSSAGLEVEWERRGDVALRRATAEVFDLVLMDLEVPGLAGLEAARVLRQREQRAGRPPVPILALTGHGGEAIAAQCKEAGMNDVLVKPFDRHRLIDRVASVIDRRPAILVVDESSALRDLYSLYLGDLTGRFRIVPHDDPDEAWRHACGGSVALALLDLEMAEPGGVALVRRLRNDPRTADLAILGVIDPEDARAGEVGCNLCLNKPMGEEALMTAVHRVLTGPPPMSLPQDDPEIRAMLPEFLARCQHDYEQLQQAVKARDLAPIRAIGHALKGSGGSFGIPEISAIGADLEQAARRHRWPVIASALRRFEGLLLNHGYGQE
ncbi:MAG: PAS domain S-box protein [Acidobacteriota bacterium]